SGDPVNGAGATGKGQQLTLLPDGFTQYMRTSLYTAIPGAQQGDRVWIRGQVEMPSNFSEFDYIGYLQRYQIYAELKKPHVIVLHRAEASWRQPLRALHDYIVNQSKVYPQKEGSLILGILIGERTSIPDDVVKAFKTTGLTHIVAVSGFNMTIIATACGALVWYIGRRATNLLTLVIVFAFVVITGATASVVRAAIMAVLMVVAQLFGRQYTSLYALLLVCSIMILQNPRIVIWDIGFQLSVAATFGVLIAFKIRAPNSQSQTQEKFGFISEFLNDALRPTLGAIAITAPIIAYHFQTFSLIAPLANLIVLPSVTWIMLFGALALIPGIGGAFIYPAQQLTSLALLATEKLSTVPYASISLNLPVWVWGIYYLGIFTFIYFRTHTIPRKINVAKTE
ncbi:MAG TPA: ComEC/Rec2 family competence protein, partial [Patescibacteria group bacterium]|nr:ComEC/Rec2 family competence protein [Patescibacteria group bacterium]